MFGLFNPIQQAQKIALVVMLALVLAVIAFFLLKVKILEREVVSLTEKISEQASTIAQLQFAKQSLEEANRQWALSVESQNAKVLELQTYQTRQQAKLKVEMQKTQKEVAKHQAEAKKWKALAHSNSSPIEKDLDAKVTDYLKERQK
jgi:hypothetical protein